ncbi:hypothetical protein HZB01_04450 [Candidatus Woesearchaeota archaeon]|nr:hypothetical protein [Candidatus Woesearchaeota archaeon]
MDMLTQWNQMRPPLPPTDVETIQQIKKKLQQLSARLERTEACCLALMTLLEENHVLTEENLGKEISLFIKELQKQRTIDKQELVHTFHSEAQTTIDEEEEHIATKSKLSYLGE